MDFPFDDVFERIKAELKWSNQKDLNEYLEITAASVSGAKKRGKFPIEWAFEIAQGHGLSTDWILTGKGPKYTTKTYEVNEAPGEYKHIVTNNGRMSLQINVDEPDQHLKHQTDFVQEVVKHVLTDRELSPPKSITRQELEMLYIFKKVKEVPDIFESFEQIALEYMIRAIHQEKGIYDDNEEEFMSDPGNLDNY